MFNRSKYLALGLAAVTVGVLGFSAQQVSAALVPGTTLYTTVVNGANTGLYAITLHGTNNVQGDAVNGFTVAPIDVSGNSDYDSLVFVNTSTIILTGDYGVTEINGFNPANNTFVSKNVLPLSVFGNNPQTEDIALEPQAVTNSIAGLTVGHQYVLVSDMGDGTIARVDVTSGTPTFVSNLGGGTNYGLTNGAGGAPGPEGLVYVPDASSATGYDLIATLGNRNNAGQRTLAQLNPATGAVVTTNEKTGLSYNDGLTYDPYSGKLFSSDRGNDKLYTDIDPLNLSAYTGTEVSFLSDGNPTGVQQPDGVEADGLGNIFDANYDSIGTPGDIEMFDETTNTMTIVAHVAGVDDISPISGVGALPQTPEPASLGLLAVGAGALMLRRRRR